MEKSKNILIVCGEASGDLHAAKLITEIKNIYPQVKFFGLGGEKSKQAGVRLYFNMVELAVVGFFEVLKNYKKFKAVFQGLLGEVDKEKPDLAILVDYPGFNLRLAEELKKRNIPLIYYISPQIWAWGGGRIKTIKRLIDRMIVVFKFEEELYRKHNVPVAFAGHPLLDAIKPKLSRDELLNKLNLNPKELTFALLPGSREKEVKTLLPIMLDTACLIAKSLGDNIQFLILRSAAVKEEIFNNIMKGYRLNAYLISDMTYEGLTACDFALVASGTATLETAILGSPMVILYKVSFLSWALLKMLIKIPYVGLVNVVRGKKVIAEFIQYGAKPRKIADYIIMALGDEGKLKQIKEELACAAVSLGEKGASRRAAQIVVDFLGNF